MKKIKQWLLRKLSKDSFKRFLHCKIWLCNLQIKGFHVATVTSHSWTSLIWPILKTVITWFAKNASLSPLTYSILNHSARYKTAKKSFSKQKFDRFWEKKHMMNFKQK